MKDFTHFDEHGYAKMVNVGDKILTKRQATASAKVLVNSDTQSCKIAGNGISVNVMQVILKSLYKRQQLLKTSLFDFVGCTDENSN